MIGATRTGHLLLVSGLLALVVLAGAGESSTPAEPRRLTSFSLKDQFNNIRHCRFPSEYLTIITVADRKGSADVLNWVRYLKEKYGAQVTIEGIADVSGVPAPLRGMVREKFRKEFPHPVMLDWQGTAVAMLGARKNQANVYVVDRDGRVLVTVAGPVKMDTQLQLSAAIDKSAPQPRAASDAPTQPDPTRRLQ